MSDCFLYNKGALKTARGARLAIAAIEKRIAECQRFYPWPALVQSLERELLEVQIIVAQTVDNPPHSTRE